MIIEIIQEAADALRALPYFSNIGVVAEDIGDPTNAIDQYLARLGLGIILMTPKGGVSHPDITGPYFDRLDFIVGIFENVKLNRAGDGSGTGKAALSVVEAVLGALHLHKPQNISEVLIAKNPAFVLVPNRQHLIYNVFLGTEGGVAFPIAKIATPTYAVVDNGDGTRTISLACATAYVYTFFTTDGSYPAPLDGNGAQRAPYTVPFTTTSPATVLVRAWMPGYLASQVVKINV